jgi:hypothetical protein
VKRLTVLACSTLAACLLALPAQGQQGQSSSGGQSSHVHESWYTSKSRFVPSRGFKHKPEHPMPRRAGTTKQSPAPSTLEPAAPAGPLAPSPETVGVGFQGDLNTTSNEVVPPDTQGAVGTTHIVSATNASINIRQRSNNAQISSQTLDQFWSALAEPDPIAFDPRVFWDHMTNRWILVAVADFESARSAVLIAISDTADPTGSWDKYRQDADSGNT